MIPPRRRDDCDVLARRREVLTALVSVLPDLDVVAFQEAWMSPARRRLVREAREAGFEHIWTNPREPGGGGMVVASRHPIEDTQFAQFGINHRKGFLGITLDIVWAGVHFPWYPGVDLAIF